MLYSLRWNGRSNKRSRGLKPEARRRFACGFMRLGGAGFLGLAVVLLSGCQSGGGGNGAASFTSSSAGKSSHRRSRRSLGEVPIRQLACIYDLKPWLNLDRAGDSDPEGLTYRVFLDTGRGKGVHREGTFHVEMYRIDRNTGEGGGVNRTLVSDWHYPTSKSTRFRSKLFGDGYVLKLRWASKDIAGSEIDVVTRYEAPNGEIVGAGTKRLMVPKYSR